MCIKRSCFIKGQCQCADIWLVASPPVKVDAVTLELNISK